MSLGLTNIKFKFRFEESFGGWSLEFLKINKLILKFKI